MRPVQEFHALRDIRVGGVFGYRTGDDITAAVVETLGLTIGVDVIPANNQVIPRPAGNAARPEWEKYAIGQGLTVDEVAEMTVSQIRERYPLPSDGDPVAVAATEQTNHPHEASPAPAGNASTEEWREWVLATQDVDAKYVEGMGRDELRTVYGPKTSE